MLGNGECPHLVAHLRIDGIQSLAQALVRQNGAISIRLVAGLQGEDSQSDGLFAGEQVLTPHPL